MYALEVKEMCKRVERICQVDPEGWYAPVIGEELVRCKDCRYFETDHWEKVNEIPLIVTHEICTRWGGGCKTAEDGYCFMAERKEE